MSNHNEETQSPSTLPSSGSFVQEYGISPMSNLSVNLGANLHIRRNLTFNSNDSTPQKGADSGECLLFHLKLIITRFKYVRVDISTIYYLRV